ncbi:MAG: coiled-coil domain-containing protein [Fusobacteriaceae bacterium]
MKKLYLVALLLFSMCIYGEGLNEEFSIEQPPLEELSLLTIRDEIKSSEVIIVMNNEIKKLKLELTVAQKRMDIIDKVIVDKNQLIDELENKVERLNTQIKESQEEEKNNKNGFEKNTIKKIYQIGAVITLLIVFIFIISLSLLVLQGTKNKKMLEEWKDIFELNRNKIDLMDQKYAVQKNKEEIEDDFDFIIKG